MKKKHLISKYFIVIFFFTFIYIVPTINLLTPDKTINEMENKVLTKIPKLSITTILNKSFMNKFDTYSSDQFPLRSSFIRLKNLFSYSLGTREYRNIYVGKDGRFMEKFIFNKEIIDKNISQATNLSKLLYKRYNISSTLMIVPNSIAFYDETLPKYAMYDSQKDALDYINRNISDVSFRFYTPYNALYKNKKKYIYFLTDHHWTQLGAYISFNDMYNLNNDTSKGYTKVSDDFLGTYYSKAMIPNIKGDSIWAYEEYNNYKMSMDFNYEYNSLYDKNKLHRKNKYQYFLHGDPAIGVIKGKGNGEILVIKDSYAHSFIPFLASIYKKVHILDPRYYNLDIDEYIKDNEGIKEVLFINNLNSFNSGKVY